MQKCRKNEIKFNPEDLVYHFDFIDSIEIQQMLIALKHGYKLRSITSAHGVVQFVLSLPTVDYDDYTDDIQSVIKESKKC